MVRIHSGLPYPIERLEVLRYAQDFGSRLPLAKTSSLTPAERLKFESIRAYQSSRLISGQRLLLAWKVSEITHSAIDNELTADGECGFIRSKKDDRFGDLRRVSQTLCRDLAFERS